MTAPRSAECPLLNVDELAERLNISVRHVRRLVAERRIPYLKVGHLLRFEPAAIDAWVQGLIACSGPTESSGRSTTMLTDEGGRKGRRPVERPLRW